MQTLTILMHSLTLTNLDNGVKVVLSCLWSRIKHAICSMLFIVYYHITQFSDNIVGCEGSHALLTSYGMNGKHLLTFLFYHWLLFIFADLLVG